MDGRNGFRVWLHGSVYSAGEVSQSFDLFVKI